jgi:hypothetical protein
MDEDRCETLNMLMKFLLKLIKDAFIFADNEFVVRYLNTLNKCSIVVIDCCRLARHYLQLQASIEVLRMLEISEVFHRFSSMNYVELFAAATVIQLTLIMNECSQ